MSALADLQRLEAITRAKYDQQQQSFQRIQAEEARLRAELARLDDMLKTSEAAAEGQGEMRAIGADILWQGWVARSKTALNIKLAQVLAIKEQQLHQVRQAFGKLQVVEQLIAETRSVTRKKMGQSQLELAMAIALSKGRPSQ